MTKPIRIESNLTPEQLRRRYDMLVVSYRFGFIISKAAINNWGRNCFIGRCTGNKLFLFHHPAYIRSALTTIFHGEIVQAEKGSAIVGRFSKSIVAIVIISIWLSLWGVGTVLVLYTGNTAVGISLLFPWLAVLAAVAFTGKGKQRMLADHLRLIASDEYEQKNM